MHEQSLVIQPLEDQADVEEIMDEQQKDKEPVGEQSRHDHDMYEQAVRSKMLKTTPSTSPSQ